jgi:streptomycin 6-kinase
VHDLAVPAVVRNKAEAAGASGWLDTVGDLVVHLERDWSIRAGPAYQDATEAYVARATLADGTPAVLKLVIPRPGEHARHEITVLRLAGGQGCVRLLRADPARGALLLERLGRSLSELGLGIQQRLEILVSSAQQVWRPAADSGLPTGADKARWLAHRCGLDETAIWEWGVAERVSTGLLATRIGLQPAGAQMLAAAERLAR